MKAADCQREIRRIPQRARNAISPLIVNVLARRESNKAASNAAVFSSKSMTPATSMCRRMRSRFLSGRSDLIWPITKNFVTRNPPVNSTPESELIWIDAGLPNVAWVIRQNRWRPFAGGKTAETVAINAGALRTGSSANKSGRVCGCGRPPAADPEGWFGECRAARRRPTGRSRTRAGLT